MVEKYVLHVRMCWHVLVREQRRAKDNRQGYSADEVIVHDADYRQSKKDFDSFVECLTEKIIEKDETIPELPAKDLVRYTLLNSPDFQRR